MVGGEREGGGHLSRSLAYDEAPEQRGPEATQQRSVAVLMRLERVPYHLRHLQASGKWLLLRYWQRRGRARGAVPRRLLLLCCCCCKLHLLRR